MQIRRKYRNTQCPKILSQTCMILCYDMNLTCTHGFSAVKGRGTLSLVLSLVFPFCKIYKKSQTLVAFKFIKLPVSVTHSLHTTHICAHHSYWIHLCCGCTSPLIKETELSWECCWDRGCEISRHALLVQFNINLPWRLICEGGEGSEKFRLVKAVRKINKTWNSVGLTSFEGAVEVMTAL